LVLVPSAGKNRPLESHEAYVPLVAAEMINSGNFIVPYFNGEPRLQKPPLAYWTVAAVYMLGGGNGQSPIAELEARFPSIIAAILLLFIAAGIGRQVSGDIRVGWVAAVLLGTSDGFFNFGQNARPEMLYAFFSALMLHGLIRLNASSDSPNPPASTNFMIWGGFGGAVLAKGPLIPLFFILSTALTLLLFRYRPTWRLKRQLLFGIMTVMTVSVYFAAVYYLIKNTGQVWKQELLQSSTAPIWLMPFQNRLAFPNALVGFIKPWGMFLPLGLFSLWRSRRLEIGMLGLAILISLVLFSFSGNIREHYVLPLLPPLFVLIGMGCVSLWDRSLDHPRWRTGLFLLLVAHLLYILGRGIHVGIQSVQSAPTGIHPVEDVLPFLSVMACASIAAAWYCYRKQYHAFFFLALAAALL
jgi:4-amino-4-deoxy-L-arabinose transferase-like glycosyltransferase